jgi:hypothetical protein
MERNNKLKKMKDEITKAENKIAQEKKEKDLTKKMVKKTNRPGMEKTYIKKEEGIKKEDKGDEAELEFIKYFTDK